MRDESIQNGGHSYQPLDFFVVLRSLQIVDCSNLIGVDLNFAIGDHIAQEFSITGAKRTLRSIKAQFVFPQYSKNIPEVVYMLGLHLTLYYHIVYVDLNIFSQLRLEHPSHHSLVSRPCVLQPKGHHFVMIIPCGRNKRSLLLII